ncbi:anhydro-N-acetylmuramic acid kinase [Ideonella sp. DXS22W]|uniref:Anhydro-N-acetylmuramic acid kinase n=1 Tax=Pseudaquabacterium inlustre TaxID=2984192 RepID=A0ABU9CRH6_9BURK
MRDLFIGLMSGTSLDGVDAVLARFDPQGGIAVQGHVHRPFPDALRADLLALNRPGADELHRAALASNGVAEAYAQAVAALLAATGATADQIAAVGAHGQTVRHRPGEFDGTGYTVQLLNGALLAERCGIDVVADLRSRDVAAGGQGAPLVPAFHAALFGQPGMAQAVLNWGGIGNLTLLGADGAVSGFDCGPGNVLLDLWCERHRRTPFDAGGAWAAQGRVDAALLATLLDEPFLHRAPPKSTGRDLFHAEWLDARLAAFDALTPVDVQATLAEFTVRAATDALLRHLPSPTRLLVCGGGALNDHLMARLAAQLPGTAVQSTASAGLPPLQVEAAAFAWLAWAFTQRRPGNRPAVTGAAGPRVLGCLHPAR